MELNVKLKVDQVLAVLHSAKHHYSINGYTMGKGKTIIALALACKFKAKTLIVAPAYLRINWLNEIKDKVSGSIVHYIASRKHIENVPVPKDCNFIVTSYSMLEHIEHLFRWADLVVADEVHMLKNPKAGRTDLFDKYLYESEVDRFLGLSGTPITNCVSEWYQLLNMCCYNPHETSGSQMQFADYYQFANHFCRTKVTKFGNKRVIKYFGIRHEAELRSLLKGKYLPTPPVELDKDGLPPLNRKTVLVSEVADKALLREFEANLSGDMSTKEKLRAAKNMVPFAVKYIRGLLEEDVGPIVAFSDHIIPVLEISSKIDRSKYITGDVSFKERASIIKDFQDGKVPLLIGTIGAMGTGVTLTRACNAVIVDPPYVPGDLEQCEKRIHRIGQEKECTIHRLAGSPQASHIMNMLYRKSKAIRRGTRL